MREILTGQCELAVMAGIVVGLECTEFYYSEVGM